MRTNSVLLAASVLISAVVGSAQDGKTADEMSPVRVANAYLDAMESSDLDAAERLFAANSLIFESGKVEGSWARYREHHIGPELDQISSFAIQRGEPVVRASADGTLAYVAWPIEYRVAFTTDREPSESLATVTFGLVLENGGYRIGHVHWSRRPKP